MELRPGFRFRPTEEELITHYLSPKIRHPNPSFKGLVIEADISRFHPAELTVEYERDGHEGTWYFFTQINRRFRKGNVAKREVARGFWKYSGSTTVRDRKGVKIGVIKKLVFWENENGERKNAKKTDWMLHEYRIDDSADNYVLWKIYLHKKKKELGGAADEACNTYTYPQSQIPPVPVSCSASFYESYAEHGSSSRLLQDPVSDGSSEILPDSQTITFVLGDLCPGKIDSIIYHVYYFY